MIKVLFCVNEAKFVFSHRWHLVKAAKEAAIIRIRPMIPTGWEATFTLEYDENIVNGANLTKAMQDAGALVGLGDWRPKFGPARRSRWTG